MITAVDVQGLKDSDIRLVEEIVERLRPSSANGKAEKHDELPEPTDEQLSAVYGALSLRYSSGRTDTAARHNEHQP